MTIDMTKGGKTKAVLMIDSGHVVLAAIGADTIAARMTSNRVSTRGRRGPRREEAG